MPTIDSASLSGALLAGLLRRMFETRGMFVTGHLHGRVEEREELTDTDAVETKRHASITGWSEDGAAGYAGPAEDKGEVLGRLSMRRRAVHSMTQREAAYVDPAFQPAADDDEGFLLLLITESDPEAGSNAVDYTLWQRAPLPPRGRVGVPLTVGNLVASATRFEAIADSVLRMGSTSRDATGGARGERPTAAATSTLIDAHCAQASALAEVAFDRVRAAQQRERELAAKVREQVERVRALQERVAKRPAKPAPSECRDLAPLDGLEPGAQGAAEAFELAVLASSASFGPAVSTVLAGAAVESQDGESEAAATTEPDHPETSEWDGPVTPTSPRVDPPSGEQCAPPQAHAPAAETGPADAAPAASSAGADVAPDESQARTMTDIFGPEAEPKPKRDAADIDTYF